MKIAISSTGCSLDDKTHDFFGRCEYLIIFDSETKQAKAIKNEHKDSESGAGIGCAQVVFDEGVTAIISGKVGPKAYEVLKQAKVDIFLSPPGMTVRTSVERHEQAMLQKMEIRKF